MAKMMITLPDGFKKDLEEFCEKNHFTHSELIRSALRPIIYPDNKEESDHKAINIFDDLK